SKGNWAQLTTARDLIHFLLHPRSIDFYLTCFPIRAGEGFINIDCGLPDGSSYLDEKIGLNYTSDDGYIDTGENHNISAEYNAHELLRSSLNLRSFPNGGRNCYTLSPATAGLKYLVRATFMHGNYDGKERDLIRSPLVFDVYMGLHFWDRIYVNSSTTIYVAEAIIVAAVSSVSVCLIDIGRGTPFLSSMEMRKMKSSLYPAAMHNQSIALQERHSLGASSLVRYPDDPYDRLWWPSQGTSGWLNLSTTSEIKRYSTDPFEVPVRVLQTAVTSPTTSTPLNLSWEVPSGWPAMVLPGYYLNMYYTDFQEQRLRAFDVYYNGYLWVPNNLSITPNYLFSDYSNATAPFTDNSGFYNVRIIATNTSVLPPMLNAYEINYLIQHDDTATDTQDVEAMMNIKTEYQVEKNWMGDPCLPEKYTWIGLTCKSDGVTSRVKTLDMSNSGLQGVISEQFSLLKSLQHLNLSFNNLYGAVPDSLTNLSSLRVLDLSGNHLDSPFPEALCMAGSLTLRYDAMNGDPCNGKSPEKKSVLLKIVVAVPVVIVALLACTLTVFCFCRKQGRSCPKSHEDYKGHVHTSDSREFTYAELVAITNNFSTCIGEGGYGPVFHGELKDGTQVAVKMHSPTSATGKGMEEFLAEVGSLTTVHHRYLVLLVGYCTEKDHLSLIYEYMPNGSLYDNLRGRKAIVQTLGWRDRAQIALEAAQGLDYLHTGCVLPIIHRDLKSHNILLGHDMVAKISDFGLSKSYINLAQSHISVTAAGTLGYIDPEYCVSGRLTTSSDVFSFGVVLLEIVTGEPPILPTHVHIVQRVKEKVIMGNIETIVDPRLHRQYDFSSIWKVVDMALLCTRESSSERPTMSMVVSHLKDALELEEARASASTISQVGSNADLSISWVASGR
ncbi:senescence-induced receptor-like serine/threonine-protein kinase, partial [Aegilops tauschii subsp. strangulata]|uniref:senescence-induced receptor-like serine/threonine-protein kinase n=1 Tax=Aegilops tauschii subsp. strangulata TaxID=200361 RepID=UPI003CC8A764